MKRTKGCIGEGRVKEVGWGRGGGGGAQVRR